MQKNQLIVHSLNRKATQNGFDWISSLVGWCKWF